MGYNPPRIDKITTRSNLTCEEGTLAASARDAILRSIFRMNPPV